MFDLEKKTSIFSFASTVTFVFSLVSFFFFFDVKNKRRNSILIMYQAYE